MVRLKFFSGEQELCEIEVNQGQAAKVISGDASWLDYSFTPMSGEGQPLRFTEDAEEWARALPAAYAGSAVTCRISADEGALSEAQRQAVLAAAPMGRPQGRLRAGWNLGRLCWNQLKANPKLLVFPLLSAVMTLIAVGAIAVPTGIVALASGDQSSSETITYIGGALAAYVSIAIAIFCNVALASCAVSAFAGQPVSIRQGIAHASSRLGVILLWALIATIVGEVLRALENSNNILQTIVVSLVGLAWAAATMFVVPVIALEKVGPFGALKLSTKTLRERWGETIGGMVSAGLRVAVLIILPAIALIAGGVYLGIQADSVAAGAPIVVGGVILFLIGALVSSALTTVLRTALYRYATAGIIPQGFTAQDLENAVYKRKKFRDRV